MVRFLRMESIHRGSLMQFLPRRYVCMLFALASLLLSGCTTIGIVASATGVATDTSVTWEIVKHLHGKLTEDDPTPCRMLDSVERALSERCGDFEVGSLRTQDVQKSSLQECPLGLAARNPNFWPVLPELLDKGAQPERCANSPLMALAQANACPDFSTASPKELQAMRWLAQADSRAIHHDVMRMLTCPSAREAGLMNVVETWQKQGELKPGLIGFSPLEALHPSALGLPLARAFEKSGWTARNSLGSYPGALPTSFELALRERDWPALEWWLKGAPELANRVPPTQGAQLPWVPLARVLVPGFLPDDDAREDVIGFLMARGADPWQRLPAQPNTTVVAYAKWMKSPLAPMFDIPLELRPERTVALPRNTE
jgi:hypothetical protein